MYIFFFQNRTKVVNKYGTTLNYFQSLFPYGCHVPDNCPSHRKRTVLDCLYNYKLKKYYVLDIIEWMGVTYTDFDVCILYISHFIIFNEQLQIMLLILF